jgi:ribosomal protein L30E
VVGIHACREAIEAGAASQLVISEELPHPDREDLVRLATLQDLPIEVCEGDDLLRSHGGVGCLLRFRMEYLHRTPNDAS